MSGAAKVMMGIDWAKAIKEKKLPASVEITKTPFVEDQEMEREIDHQKRLVNPDFKGAFHEKKKSFHTKQAGPKKKKRR